MWLDDLQLYLLSDSRDSILLFDHTSGVSLAPPATADSATRSQWLTHDAGARLAVRNHLPLAEPAHFGHHKTAKALYDAVVARYSSPTTAALGCLILPYLFPELSAFATVEDLITHLSTSDTRYRAALPAEFLDRNPPPMCITLYFIVTRLPDSLSAVKDQFLALEPTYLTVDLLEKHFLAAETSVVAEGAACGTPCTPFFEGCPPSPLAPSYASAAAVDILGIEAAALGASESALPRTAPAEALHTFTLDSDASRCFFRDSTTLTPLPAPVPVRVADPSGGPPGSPLPAPSPYAEQTGSLTERHEPESRPTSPVRAVRTGRRIPRLRPPPVLGTHIMALRPSSVPLQVPLPSPPASSLADGRDPESDLARATSPTVPRVLAIVVTNSLFESTAASALSDCPPSVGGECVLGTDVVEDRQEDVEYLSAAVPHLMAMLLAPEGDPDAPDIPIPRSYAKAIMGPYSSQWQTAMDAEMASWKSTGTYVDAVPPTGANIVDGMWIFRVKLPSGSPPVFKAHYVARGFSQRQGADFLQTFSPTPKIVEMNKQE
ncbi:unnamed protein product [Closterium sp. NIES-54]